MPLSRVEYEQLIVRLEAQARRHSTLFRMRVALLVTIGLLAIPLAVLCALALLLLSLSTVVAWAGGIIDAAFQPAKDRLFAALYASRWNVCPPHGVELHRAQAPRLFALLDDLARQLKAPRCHHVLLDTNFNAAISVFPRFGPLGWQRHYLLIGMPLLLALSTEHFTAVLAHEVSHLSGRHGHLALWLLRAQEAWARFTEYLEENDAARVGMNWFFRWYSPLLSPRNFVLRRLDEIEADRQTAVLLGNRIYAEQLVRSYLMSDILGRGFWREIHQLISQQPAPPQDIYTRMISACRQTVTGEDAQEALDKSLDKASDFLDPHLALRDRLAQLGFTAEQVDGQWRLPADLRLPGPPLMTAAEVLLGDSLESVMDTCSRAWWLNDLDRWTACHHALVKAQQQLEAQRQAEVNVEQLHKRAQAVLEVAGEDDAIPLFRQVLALDPCHVGSHFTLGRLLLERKEDAGIAHLEQVMHRDRTQARKACRLIYNYLVRERRPAEADVYAQKDEEIIRAMRLARKERSGFDLSTGFQLHSWGDQEIAALCRQLAAIPQVERAYPLRQQVVNCPEQPHYILGVFSDTPLRSPFRWKARKLYRAVCERIQSQRDYDVYLLNEDEHGAVLARWTDIRGALVYRRDRNGTGERSRHAVRA